MDRSRTVTVSGLEVQIEYTRYPVRSFTLTPAGYVAMQVDVIQDYPEFELIFPESPPEWLTDERKEVLVYLMAELLS